MKVIAHWARRSHERAVANARAAATEASRRRVEAAEVAAYVGLVWGPAHPGSAAEEQGTAAQR
jgi:hypothetical protein